MQRQQRETGLAWFWLVAALVVSVSPCTAQGGPQPVRAAHGMVASAEERATEVGVAILKKGGNAVDAAVAVGMALAVTYPVAGNLGGGGFMLIRMASGETVAIDYREVAPQLATRNMYLDAQGNAVTNTYTLNGAYGCGVTVRGAGFLLNNEMDDFAAKPGTPNGYGLVQGEANAIAPGKRPLSSMTPTIVLKDGKLYLVIGSPGGPTIITTVLQVILNVVDFDMNLREAIAAPRIHHQWLPDIVRHEAYRFPSDVREALLSLGHKLGDSKLRGSYWGDAEGIMVDPASGLYLGVSDPRSNDSSARGY